MFYEDNTLPLNAWGKLTHTADAEGLDRIENDLKMAQGFGDDLDALPMAALVRNEDGALEVSTLRGAQILEELVSGYTCFDAVWELGSRAEWEFERTSWGLAAGTVQTIIQDDGMALYRPMLHEAVARRVRGCKAFAERGPLSDSLDAAMEWLEDVADHDLVDIDPIELKKGREAALRMFIGQDLERARQLADVNRDEDPAMAGMMPAGVVSLGDRAHA
ncbi:hypothetical protein [Thioalkalivibrio sp. ALE19]|uniref:hypothetical protein n=1 Tax=Thioalkalivibrio sp. ALE19 TaxID=1266909 RepID=UPI0004169444|nr:hypothetical protein [Thioalkalivibrio sp. ALE19]